jgi:microcystin-dependent protein
MANISKFLKDFIATLSTVATSGSYNDLSGKPTLSTVATSGSYNDLSGKPTLSTVATSGSYNDLSDKPLTVIPRGIILPFAANTPPEGFLECNGSEISRTTYSGLFTLIGDVFGVGDGSTTFNIPDLRGEFIRGWDNSRGVDSGRSFGSSQLDIFKSHKHGLANGLYGGNAKGIAFSNSNPATGTYDANTQIGILAEGGNETRPRNIALMYCIKY